MPLMRAETRSCGRPVEPYTVTFATENTYVDDLGKVSPQTVVWDMATACHADSPKIASEGAVLPEDTDAAPSGGVVGLCPHEVNLLTTGRVNPSMDVALSPRWKISISPAPQN